MSRRAGSGVRGPNSALTEFLRERGINHASIQRRQEEARRQAREQAAQNAGNAMGEEENAPATENATVEEAPVSSRRRTTQTQTVAASSSATAVVAGPSVEKKKGKKRKKGDGDDGGDDDWANPYKSVPTPGQIAFCDECDSRFTVTAYSKASADGDGLLCTACGKKSAKQDKATKTKRTHSKKVKRETLRQMLDGEATGPKSLREYCIRLVAKYIDDVEALGDIGTINMDRICQIISRNRSLNNTTMKLFLDPGSEKLTLYDCGRIDTNELRTIAAVVSTLKHLSLVNAGRLTDEVLDYYAEKLTALTSFHLHGAFLISRPALISFFTAMSGRLTSLSICNTARTSEDVFTAIAKHCPDLTELRLCNLYRLDDACIRLLAPLQNLRVLDLSRAGTELTDDAVVELLNSVGSGLKELNLSANSSLSAPTISAIHACCTRLQHLDLADLELVTDEDIRGLFTNWDKNPGVAELNLSRVVELEDTGLAAIADHSGLTLESLDINSCSEISKDGLLYMLKQCKRLSRVDVGFIRQVDDEVVEKMQVQGANSLAVWGCARVTEVMGVRQGVHIVGREADLASAAA